MTEQEAKTVVTGDLLVCTYWNDELCVCLGRHKDDMIYDPTLLFKVLVAFRQGPRLLRFPYNWLDKL